MVYDSKLKNLIQREMCYRKKNNRKRRLTIQIVNIVDETNMEQVPSDNTIFTPCMVNSFNCC